MENSQITGTIFIPCLSPFVTKNYAKKKFITRIGGQFFSITGTYINSANLNSENANVSQLTGINENIENISGNYAFFNTLHCNSFTGEAVLSLTGQNLIYTNAFINNLTGINASFSNITGSNIITNNASINNCFINNISGNFGIINDLQGNNLSYSNISGPNLQSINLRATNITGTTINYNTLSCSNVAGSQLNTSGNIVFKTSSNTGSSWNVITRGGSSVLMVGNKISGGGVKVNTFSTILDDGDGGIMCNAISGYTGLFNNLICENISGSNLTFTNISGNRITGNIISFLTLLTGSSAQFSSLKVDNITSTNINSNNISGNNGFFNTLNVNNPLILNNISGTNLAFTNISGFNISGNRITGNTISFNLITGSNAQFSSLKADIITGNNLNILNINVQNISGNNGFFDNLSVNNISGNRITGSTISFTTLLTGTNAQFQSSIIDSITSTNINSNNISGNNGFFNNLTINNPLVLNNISGTNLAFTNISGFNISGNTITGNIISFITLLTGNNAQLRSLISDNISGTNLAFTNISGFNIQATNISTSNISATIITGTTINYNTLSCSNSAGSQINTSGNIVFKTTSNTGSSWNVITRGGSSVLMVANKITSGGVKINTFNNILDDGDGGIMCNSISGYTGLFNNLFCNNISGVGSITGFTNINSSNISGNNGFFNTLNVNNPLVLNNISGTNLAFTNISGFNISGNTITGNNINFLNSSGINSYIQSLKVDSITGINSYIQNISGNRFYIGNSINTQKSYLDNNLSFNFNNNATNSDSFNVVGTNTNNLFKIYNQTSGGGSSVETYNNVLDDGFGNMNSYNSLSTQNINFSNRVNANYNNLDNELNLHFTTGTAYKIISNEGDIMFSVNNSTGVSMGSLVKTYNNILDDGLGNSKCLSISGTNLNIVNGVFDNLTVNNHLVSNTSGTNLAFTNISGFNISGNRITGSTISFLTLLTGSNAQFSSLISDIITGTNIRSTNLNTTNITGTTINFTTLVGANSLGSNINTSGNIVFKTTSSTGSTWNVVSRGGSFGLTVANKISSGGVKVNTFNNILDDGDGGIMCNSISGYTGLFDNLFFNNISGNNANFNNIRFNNKIFGNGNNNIDNGLNINLTGTTTIWCVNSSISNTGVLNIWNNGYITTAKNQLDDGNGNANFITVNSITSSAQYHNSPYHSGFNYYFSGNIYGPKITIGTDNCFLNKDFHIKFLPISQFNSTFQVKSKFNDSLLSIQNNNNTGDSSYITLNNETTILDDGNNNLYNYNSINTDIYKFNNRIEPITGSKYIDNGLNINFGSDNISSDDWSVKNTDGDVILECGNDKSVMTYNNILDNGNGYSEFLSISGGTGYLRNIHSTNFNNTNSSINSLTGNNVSIAYCSIGTMTGGTISFSNELRSSQGVGLYADNYFNLFFKSTANNTNVFNINTTAESPVFNVYNNTSEGGSKISTYNDQVILDDGSGNSKFNNISGNTSLFNNSKINNLSGTNINFVNSKFNNITGTNLILNTRPIQTDCLLVKVLQNNVDNSTSFTGFLLTGLSGYGNNISLSGANKSVIWFKDVGIYQISGKLDFTFKNNSTNIAGAIIINNGLYRDWLFNLIPFNSFTSDGYIGQVNINYIYRMTGFNNNILISGTTDASNTCVCSSGSVSNLFIEKIL